MKRKFEVEDELEEDPTRPDKVYKVEEPLPQVPSGLWNDLSQHVNQMMVQEYSYDTNP